MLYLLAGDALGTAVTGHPLGVQRQCPHWLFGRTPLQQAHEGILVSDGDGFVTFDGRRLEHEGAVGKGVGVGSGIGGGIYAEAVEVVVLWDGGLEEAVEDVWLGLEAVDGVVEGSYW